MYILKLKYGCLRGTEGTNGGAEGGEVRRWGECDTTYTQTKPSELNFIEKRKVSEVPAPTFVLPTWYRAVHAVSIHLPRAWGGLAAKFGLWEVSYSQRAGESQSFHRV